MRFYPTRIHVAFVCFILTSVTINLGCSKDSDLLLDSVIEDSTSIVEEREKTTSEEQNTDEQSTEENEDTTEGETAATLESRTTSFSPTNDAHIQSGKGYNQNIIRLQEGQRTSYLMFDMSPIDAIGGTISGASLQFTINSDDGSGHISVFKGKSNDWTEDSLSESTVPETDVQVGSIIKEYKIGVTEIIELDDSQLLPEISTLILNHKDGNDLAFASKEHVSKIGPKLVVTYDVPEGASEISISEEDTTEEDTTGEENQEPVAVSDATPSSGGVPLEVSFTGSNSADDKEITSYFWDFKDGATATTADPTHTFTEVGVYEVTLTVEDAEGLSSSDVVNITVGEDKNEAPNAVVSATPVSGEAPLEVSFKGSDSTDDNSITTYAWDFKDGSRTNIADFKYTYREAGVYEAELKVTDENGLSDTATITITVTEAENEAPEAKITANPTSGNAPLNVQFTGNTSTDDDAITSYQWDFKDGTSATNQNPSHSFSEAGTYEVELTVKDKEGLSDKKSVTITVTEAENQAPVAIISSNKTSGQAPLEVQFVGDASSDDKGISSYFWDFKDGSTATNINPSHTFSQAGSYAVELTVRDAEGLSNTATINITANADTNNGGGNAPPGYYVATNGSSSNNGTSPSSPWSLEHAFNTAAAGDIVYVKAGNYGSKQLLTKRPGSSGNLIKFIGYRSTPGDISSSNGSTFNYGEAVSSSKMPLLNSSSSSGVAITLHHRYIQIENFQISGYGTGIQTIDNATNVILKNIIAVKQGSQGSSGAYNGFGLTVRGNNSTVENCFVLNSVAQGITLSNSDYSMIKNCAVYADNATNPMDYYILLADGTNNSVVEKSHVQRAVGLSHNGHGLNIKDDGTYNTFKNCTAVRTSFELTYFGVHHNTIDGGSIKGVNTSSSRWDARLAIVGGAHHNTIKNLLIEDTWTAISWATFNDRTGADASIGNDNNFDNITIKNTNRMLNVGGGTNYQAKAKRNKFTNCNITDFESVAVTYYGTEDIEFRNCSFRNGQKLVTEFGGVYAPYSSFDASWINCTWSNVNFTPPN